MQFINTSTEEVRDILVAVIILTAAFLLLDVTNYGKQALISNLPLFITAALISVLTAFLMHELSHRYVARKHGQYAYFKLWPMGALLALVTSFLGIIFAAPGAVYYHGYGADRELNGKISLAGPGMNLVLGTALTAAGVISGNSIATVILLQAGRLNFWFAFFNLIPFWQLDGAKVYAWNKELFLVVIAFALVGTVLLSY